MSCVATVRLRAGRGAFAVLILAVTVIFPVGAFAAEGGDVWDRLAAQDQARGSFTQLLLDEEGALIERSSGRYAILRPGYFRWEIDQPDRQQLVVADGTLWHYDMDLGTVTVRALDPDTQFTALDLLARDQAELVQRFSVEQLSEDRFRLLPRFPRAGFGAVVLSWERSTITAMEVQQRGGQTLSLALTPDTDGAPLRAEDFVFEVPPGVEVQRGSDY
jgi:outer membrane lipoprotein carrier protein